MLKSIRSQLSIRQSALRATIVCLVLCGLAPGEGLAQGEMDALGRKVETLFKQLLPPPPNAREGEPRTDRPSEADSPVAQTRALPTASRGTPQSLDTADVIGILLGTSGRQALKLLGAHNSRLKFIELTDGPPGNTRASGWRAEDRGGRVVEEFVVLVHPGTDTIWFVNRHVWWYDGGPLIGELKESLVRKYGPPDAEDRLLWSRTAEGSSTAASRKACMDVLSRAAWDVGSSGIPGQVNPGCRLGILAGWQPIHTNPKVAIRMWQMIVDASSMYRYMTDEAQRAHERQMQRAKSTKPAL